MLRTPPADRTPDGLALLLEHAKTVAPLLANLERSLRRKAQTEERAEEREDSSSTVLEHVAVLVNMLKERKSFVLHTGAGFSTAANIPDFRGRNGVWTMQAKGKAVPMPRFENTVPTRAHMAAVALYRAGYLKHVITQNVDGLHQRAGLPASIVSELHGSVYREECRTEGCEKEDEGVLRTFDVTATKPHNGGAGAARSPFTQPDCVSWCTAVPSPHPPHSPRHVLPLALPAGRHRHKTGRTCSACGGELHDTVVQFGEHLDDDTLEAAIAASEESPLSLVAGTSLKVPPASTLPRRSSALVVCNLQWTSQDKHAALKIHAKCDEVMLAICRHLEVEVPPYAPEDDPVGREVLAMGGGFASPPPKGGSVYKPEGGIRNAAAVYGGRGDGATDGGGGGGGRGGGEAGPSGGGASDGDEMCYASPETWAGGRRDARVLFGEADGGKKSRRRTSNGGTEYEGEVAPGCIGGDEGGGAGGAGGGASEEDVRGGGGGVSEEEVEAKHEVEDAKYGGGDRSRAGANAGGSGGGGQGDGGGGEGGGVEVVREEASGAGVSSEATETAAGADKGTKLESDPTQFADLSKAAKRMKKPCMPRPNMPP